MFSECSAKIGESVDFIFEKLVNTLDNKEERKIYEEEEKRCEEGEERKRVQKKLNALKNIFNFNLIENLIYLN